MKKPLHNLKSLITSFILLASASSSQSAIIDYGNYFSDTSSGLDWLDVTASVNRSYNDVFSQLAPGGDFAGWRYASSKEFNTLLSSWTGIAASDTGRTLTTGTTPSVDGLVMLFGSTLDSRWISSFGQTWDSQRGFAEGEGIDFTLGILSEPVTNAANQRSVGSIWDNERFGTTIDFYNANHRQVFTDEMHADIGSFLVRTNSYANNPPDGPVTNVDEPGAFILLAFGLTGIIAVRRQKV